MDASRCLFGTIRMSSSALNADSFTLSFISHSGVLICPCLFVRFFLTTIAPCFLSASYQIPLGRHVGSVQSSDLVSIITRPNCLHFHISHMLRKCFSTSLACHRRVTMTKSRPDPSMSLPWNTRRRRSAMHVHFAHHFDQAPTHFGVLRCILNFAPHSAPPRMYSAWLEQRSTLCVRRAQSLSHCVVALVLRASLSTAALLLTEASPRTVLDRFRC